MFFCIIAVAVEKSRLFSPSAIPTGRLTQQNANAAVETPTVIAVDIICNACIKLFHFYHQPYRNFDFMKEICLNLSLFFIV